MKKIVLLTDKDTMKQRYGEEITALFSDKLSIKCYSMECDLPRISKKNLLRDADVLVVTGADIYSAVKSHTSQTCRVIQLHYSYLLSKIEALKSLPSGLNAVLCFDFIDVTIETMSLLYEAGISNLNLFASHFNAPGEHSQSYDIALFSEKPPETLPPAKLYFDLGKRKLSFSTIIEIALSTEILDAELERRILHYCSSSMGTSNYVKGIYGTSSYVRAQLQTIMDYIDYSIIIYDAEYTITNFNIHTIELLHLDETELLSGQSIFHFPQLKFLFETVKREEDVSDELIEMNNKNIVISKKKIRRDLEDKNTHIILMKDVTELMRLENSLRRKLKQKGHIAKYHFSDLIGISPCMSTCISRAKSIAQIDKPTLITGESGTGKELFAQAIHNESERKMFPFIGINCAAIPIQLLESELFGYAEGSFTGARKGGKEGLFEMAQHGTLFLDEIGEISLETQAKLLRVLEEKEIMKIGSGEIIPVDVRIIAATNQDLKLLMREGKFRKDLYYRINNIIITVPPLRERRDDIPLLIRHFIEKENRTLISMEPEAENLLVHFPWEGNVRELRNCAEYMAHISGGRIKKEHLPEHIINESREVRTAAVPEEYVPAPASTPTLIPLQKKKILLAVLRFIENTGGSRKSIYDAFQSSETPISDYALRQMLTYMREQGCISYKKGRGGIRLTAAGKAYLSEIDC